MNTCKLCNHPMSIHKKTIVNYGKKLEQVLCQQRIGVLPESNGHLHEACACDGTSQFWERLVNTRYSDSDVKKWHNNDCEVIREFVVQRTPDGDANFYPINKLRER